MPSAAPDARLIILLLGLAVLLGMQETLFQAAFRCVGKYPLGTMAKSLVVLAAFLSTMVGVALHLSPVPVTVLYVAVNAVGVVRPVDSAPARSALDPISAFATRNGRSFAASPDRLFLL